MAFSDGKAVMERTETFICSLFQKLQGEGLVLLPPKLPFLRMPYREAMLNFGTDKPDLRIPEMVRNNQSYCK
jgi:aspartyl-tRNA synthetase